MIRSSIAIATSLAAVTLAAPAAAQDTAGDQVRMVIVYGDDAAPEPVGDEIVVVARKPEAERFRIPEGLRFSDSPSNTAWTERVERYELIGDFGTLSCDPAGAGGFLGCTKEMIDAAYADRAGSSEVRFGQLIEAARAERLAGIDEEAAAEQARVEELERQYMERLEAEREEPVDGEAVDPDLPPVVDTSPAIDPAAPGKDVPFDDGDETIQPIDSQAPAAIGSDG